MNTYERIISGAARGPLAGLARGVLSAAASVYAVGVNARNRRFDTGRSRAVLLDVPVISVGNITVGGTGKTPVCIWLAERLVEMELRPAVVSRGYGARRDAPNDEMMVVSQRVPSAICVANPVRIAAAEFAVEEYGAQVIVMDDGFQHRALARDLDVVLIDATRPLGYGHVLPRGLLREAAAGLARADLLIVTRADLIDAGAWEALRREVAALAPEAPIVRCRHRAVGFLALHDSMPAAPGATCRRVFVSAGIGNPDAFVAGVRRQGFEAAGACWWPDHHSFRAAHAETILAQAARAEAQGVLTTEKDLVKLRPLDVRWTLPVWAMRVDIDFLEDGHRIVLDHVRRTIEESRQRREPPA